MYLPYPPYSVGTALPIDYQFASSVFVVCSLLHSPARACAIVPARRQACMHVKPATPASRADLPDLHLPLAPHIYLI
eukprot:6184772-Pleurochrysis_carterae.AAC.1